MRTSGTYEAGARDVGEPYADAVKPAIDKILKGAADAPLTGSGARRRTVGGAGARRAEGPGDRALGERSLPG
ncbi:hypothetical protein [Pseudonocardia sp. T1-2H]|uniref:hypothetical protein n=1 Tax=Pseudonocardia sp. T1-2H TaxID=3128899 RepID=UPI003101ADE9